MALIILSSCIRVATRRDWLDASLMLAPTAPVVAWLAVLHQSGGVRESAASSAGADTALAVMILAMAVVAFVRVRTRAAKVATMFATAALMLLTVSSVYETQLSLPALTARALLLIGFLLSPAALEAITLRSLGPTADEE